MAKAKWNVVIGMLVAAAAAAGCGTDEDDPGEAPGFCDRVVESYDECPTPQELCTPQSCGGLDCCYVEGGRWQHVITDCFDGCPGNQIDAGVDAPDDGPPSDGCGSFDAAAAVSSALPHC